MKPFSCATRRLVAGARDVFGVAAAVLMRRLRRQLEHAVGQRARGSADRATRTACVPSKSASALISISLVAMSRWLVGSSSTRKFGGSYSMLAPAPAAPSRRRRGRGRASRRRRRRSRSSRRACAASRCAACGNGCSSDLEHRLLAGRADPSRAGRSSRASRCAPSATAPSSGSVAPATSLSSVDLPAPLTPITHQRSLRRTGKSKPS